MPVDSFAVFLRGHDVSFSPAEIERELSSMWKPVSEKVDTGEESGSVSRVVLGSLIWAGPEHAIERVRNTIAKLVPKYPCRLFLLEFRENQEGGGIQAAVNAQCFRPQPGGQPVCCEVISLTFGPEGARHVRGCVTPLLIGDLQTVLWDNFGEARPEGAESLDGEAERIIHQAARWKHPARGLERSLHSAVPAFDLAWFRLTPVREQVTAFFDDPHASFSLEGIRRVRVQTLGNVSDSALPEVMGALFVGWLGTRLGWEVATPHRSGFRYRSGDGHVLIEFDTMPAKGRDFLTQLGRIEMEHQSGERFHLTLNQEGGGMDLWLGEGHEGPPQRRLILSELGEADALGLALNTPWSAEPFRGAARLAVPLLEYYHPDAEAP